jgi:hypothetical protein
LHDPIRDRTASLLARHCDYLAGPDRTPVPADSDKPRLLGILIEVPILGLRLSLGGDCPKARDSGPGGTLEIAVRIILKRCSA